MSDQLHTPAYESPYRRQPDCAQFLKVLTRKGRPDHLPLYEHIASGGFVSEFLGTDIGRATGQDYWRLYVSFWLGLGFDCIPMEISMPLSSGAPHGRPADAPAGESDQYARIFSMRDFEDFVWPDEDSPIDFEPFEIVAGLIPEGVKIVAGVGGGPFERGSRALLGLTGLSYALVDQPELVAAVFGKLRRMYVNANKTLASMDAVCATRQGDDLGFKTSTFLPPDALREHIFPIYRELADVAHAASKPFVLHSCGDLGRVYEDIIDCGVDAKHSFEEQIFPVGEFKRQYGDRITPLGGLDVDAICRADERTLRSYTRKAIEECFAVDGHWALGTGNSLTDYMPVGNYLIVLDEAAKVTGR